MAANDRGSTLSHEGVRNRLFEHPDYGYSFIWDKAVWGPTGSTGNELTLVSPPPDHDSASSETKGAIEITFGPRDMSADQRIERTVEDMRGRHDYADIIAPHDGHARGTTNDGAKVWDFYCRHLSSGEESHLLLFVIAIDAADYIFLEEKSEDIWKSVKSPDVGWVLNPNRTIGVLDVFRADPRWEGSTVTLELVLKNVDEHPSEFDLARFFVADRPEDGSTRYPATGVVWDDGNGSDPVRQLPKDGTLSGTLTFEGIGDPAFKRIFYQESDEHSHEIVEVGGPVGSSGRPRIDPGR